MRHLDHDDVAAALEAERTTVLHQLHELGSDESGELTGDVDFGSAFADAGAATAERTETIGVVDGLKKRLDEVAASLARLADGTFGVCTECGNDIKYDRLAFRPTSAMCVSCKASTR